MLGLSRAERQQRQSRVAAPRRSECGLHRRAAAAVPRGGAHQPGDAAARRNLERPGHRRSGRLLRVADADRTRGRPLVLARRRGAVPEGRSRARDPGLRRLSWAGRTRQSRRRIPRPACATGRVRGQAAERLCERRTLRWPQSAAGEPQRRDDVQHRQASDARADPRRRLLRAGHALISRRKMLRALPLAALLALSACSRQAPAPPPPAGKWKPGVHYDPLVPAQPTSVAPGKVEVVEVLWLACPHCYALEPYIGNWLKTKPSYVEFVRVPVMWQPIHRAHARLYYALDALGRQDLIAKAFDTIHDLAERKLPPLVGSSDD